MLEFESEVEINRKTEFNSEIDVNRLAYGGSGGGSTINYTKLQSVIKTTDWFVTSSPIVAPWVGQDALTWSANDGVYYIQGGTEDLGLSAGGSYSAVLTIDGTDYEPEYSQAMDESGMVIFVAQYNSAVMLQILDHCAGFDTEGDFTVGNGYYVMVIPIGGAVPSSVIVKSFSGAGKISATIENSAIKVNSAATLYINYAGVIDKVSKEDGIITLTSDSVPTQDIPFDLEIFEIDKEGLFEIINNYIPSVPEIPEALPQTASAVKTGTWTAGRTEITIPDSDITYTSDVDVNISYKGEVSGWVSNRRFHLTSEVYPTSDIQFTYKVKQTDSTGQINIINSFTGAVGAKITGELSTTEWTMTYPEWAESNLPAERKWNSVAYGNGVFVAVASPTQYGAYSENGITWTEISLPESRGWVSVTYGGDKFVAVASNTQYGAYSTDGINWTTMTMPASRYWTDITYGNGKFVAIAENSSKYGAYSTDGINWTTMTMPAGRSWVSVAYGNNKFVAVTSATQYGAYSTDGITWTQMSLDATRDWTGITYGNGKFVAVATDSEYGAYSTDGIRWTYMQLPETAYWHDITYGNGMFVATAEYNSIVAYSTDGINWFTKTLMSTSRWYGVIYGSGKFITVANSSAYAAYWDVSKSSYSYSIWDSAIGTNSAVTMYLESADEVRAYSKEGGHITVEMDNLPTEAIPYTLQIILTSAEGAFEIVNSYVPVIPTDNSELTNGAGYITNTPEHLYLTDTSTGTVYEVTISDGVISLVAQ